VVIEAGDEDQKKWAAGILPIRQVPLAFLDEPESVSVQSTRTVFDAFSHLVTFCQRGNWLLCTLLLGNVAVNALLSILLAEMTSGERRCRLTLAFAVSERGACRLPLPHIPRYRVQV